MKKKREVYTAKEKMLEPKLSGMRDIAYGHDMQVHIAKMTNKSISEQAEIDKIQAAFDKRTRRAAKLKKG